MTSGSVLLLEFLSSLTWGFPLFSFPYEAVPDGTVFAPHHFYHGVLATLLVVWVVSDDRRDREAWLVAVMVVVALVGFVLTWRHYPAVGAAMSLLGLSVAFCGVIDRALLDAWKEYPILLAPYAPVAVVCAACGIGFWPRYRWAGPRGIAFIGLAVALDDVVEHAFGVPTPLDWVWANGLYDVVRAIEALAA